MEDAKLKGKQNFSTLVAEHRKALSTETKSDAPSYFACYSLAFSLQFTFLKEMLFVACGTGLECRLFSSDPDNGVGSTDQSFGDYFV